MATAAQMLKPQPPKHDPRCAYWHFCTCGADGDEDTAPSINLSSAPTPPKE